MASRVFTRFGRYYINRHAISYIDVRPTMHLFEKPKYEVVVTLNTPLISGSATGLYTKEQQITCIYQTEKEAKDSITEIIRDDD